MIDPFTQSGTLHSDEENAFSGFFDDLKIQSVPQLFTVQAPIDTYEEEDHLATLGTKVEESTGKKKNHKRWNSYDHSALKPPNLLSKMKGSSLKMSKSQPAT